MQLLELTPYFGRFCLQLSRAQDFAEQLSKRLIVFKILEYIGGEGDTPSVRSYCGARKITEGVTVIAVIEGVNPSPKDGTIVAQDPSAVLRAGLVLGVVPLFVMSTVGTAHHRRG